MSTTRTTLKRQRESAESEWSDVCEVCNIPDKHRTAIVCSLADMDVAHAKSEKTKLKSIITLHLGKVQPSLECDSAIAYADTIYKHLMSVDNEITDDIQQQKPTLLFSLGLRPFKIAVKLPNQMQISLQTVYTACRMQSVPSPPSCISSGVFHFIREVEGTNIYVYNIKEVKGCKRVHTDFHGKLPPPITECCTSVELLKYSKANECGVGNIINREDGTTLVAVFEESGKVVSKYTEKESGARGVESDITKDVHEYLNNNILANGDCKAVFVRSQQHNDHNLCAFKGGGDILLDHGGAQTILTLGGAYGGNEEEEEDNNEEEDNQVISPVYQDEVRAGSTIEIKHRPRDREQDIVFQLRANMILGLSKELYKLLENDTLSNLYELNKMSMYGMTFGYHSPLSIFKETVDFTKQKIETRLRYTAPTSHSWAVDASISYVLQRMKAKSSPTPEPDLNV